MNAIHVPNVQSRQRTRNVTRIAAWWLAITVSMVSGFTPSPVAAQASQLTPLGATLASCDDCSYEVSLTSVFPTGVRFGGSVYTSIWVGTNGYVTFGHSNRSYSPLGIAGYTLGPIVAGQFDDIDPNKGGTLYYNQNAAEEYVAATFSGVAPYSTPTEAGSGANSFQIVLRPVATDPQDFQIELRYIDMNWAGSGNVRAWPTAGWSTGDGNTYGEVEVSGQATFLSAESGSNVGETGIYRWNVEGGVVQSTPTVTATASVTSIAASSAQSGGTVGADGGSPVTARGIAWGTSTAPTIAGDIAVSGSGTGTFTANLSGLDPGVTYYVRAWATNALGTAYGPERSFTTPTQLSQAITFAALEALTYGDPSLELSATATSGLGVAFATDAPDVATVSGTTLTITGAGTVTITASQAGNAGWQAADPVARSLTIVPRPVQGTFTVPDSKVYDGTAVAQVLDRGLIGVLATDTGRVALTGGTARYTSTDVALGTTVELEGAELLGDRAEHYQLDEIEPRTADILPGAPHHVALTGPDHIVAGEASFQVLLVVEDAFGNPTPVSAETTFGLDAATTIPGAATDLRAVVPIRSGRSSTGFDVSGTYPEPGALTVSAVVQEGGSIPAGETAELVIEVHPSRELASFGVEAAGGGDIGVQSVGVPFDIQITALDPHGGLLAGFDGSVDLSAVLGTDVTSLGAAPVLEAGILRSHTVMLDAPGSYELRAASGPVSGVGRPFIVVGPGGQIDVDLQIDNQRPAPGDLVTLRVVVTNLGDTDAVGLGVDDPLSAQDQLHRVDAVPDRGSVEQGTGIWTIDQLRPGEQAKLVIRARVISPESTPTSTKQEDDR